MQYSIFLESQVIKIEEYSILTVSILKLKYLLICMTGMKTRRGWGAAIVDQLLKVSKQHVIFITN